MFEINIKTRNDVSTLKKLTDRICNQSLLAFYFLVISFKKSILKLFMLIRHNICITIKTVSYF